MRALSQIVAPRPPSKTASRCSAAVVVMNGTREVYKIAGLGIACTGPYGFMGESDKVCGTTWGKVHGDVEYGQKARGKLRRDGVLREQKRVLGVGYYWDWTS